MEQLNYVKEYRPRIYSGSTSMISLIVPPNHDLDGLRQRMKKEKQTAVNIKSNTNRKSVVDALGSIYEHLKRIKNIPPTGMALYAEQYI